ncbi:MAG: branched-chain amino acid ABC transporter ATP-binding protein/permease [Bellilinea sp.]|jgi:branched-chain amino acid transport system permease protein
MTAESLRKPKFLQTLPNIPWLFLALIPLLIVLPLTVRGYALNVLIIILMWGAISSAANILVGYAGQVCFIPPLFTGVGAYISTWLLINLNVSPWIGMFMAGAVAAILALAIGFLFFRYGLKGVYFALGTMALVLVAQVLFTNLPWFGRSEGLYIIIRETDPLMMKFRDKLPYYYIVLGLTIAIFLVTNWISTSKPGYWLRAIRENQDAAEAVGVNLMRYKQLAIGVSAFLLGMMGTFWANFLTYFDPYTAFHWEIAGLAIIIIVAGGAGTVWGPLLGSAILVPMTELVRAQLGDTIPGLHMVVYGAVLMLVLLYLPDGFLSIFTKVKKWWNGKKKVGKAEPVAHGNNISLSNLFPHIQQVSKELFHVGRTADNSSILEVARLTRLFGGLRAVDDLTFKVKAGEIFGIIGPNGAGKTTTFNMIAGAIKPTSGTIKFKGEEIAGLLPHVICDKGIGRTFQLTQSFPKLTALETVMVGSFLRYSSSDEARQRALDILEVVGLLPKAHTLTENLTLADLKRLEIAKALATDPEVVLLDEVIAGLTDVEIEEVVGLIKKINKETGITIIMIEHVMHVIMSLCDRVLVLNFGKQIAEGTSAEVTSDPQVIEAYLGQKVEFDNA